MTIPKQILVPTDFSDSAEHAVDYAFELARALGGKVHLLHVWAIPPAPDSLVLTGNVIDDVAQAAQAGLDASVAKRKNLPELGEVVLQLGDPREIIVATARKLSADLIVMGTHGRRGFKRFILGSVAESVLRTAPCPVLAVRPPEPKEQAG
jgi:nucleotide-binding universal stress UspA family protein